MGYLGPFFQGFMNIDYNEFSSEISWPLVFIFHIWPPEVERINTYSNGSSQLNDMATVPIYSEIPLLRPHKIKTFCQSKTFIAKFKLFFSSFSTPSVSLIRDHLWDCLKVVFKTTFGHSQRGS